MEEIKKEVDAPTTEKEYYTKAEVENLLNKKLLDFTTDLLKRIDEPKKVEVVEKKQLTLDDYKF